MQKMTSIRDIGVGVKFKTSITERVGVKKTDGMFGSWVELKGSLNPNYKFKPETKMVQGDLQVIVIG